MGRVWPTFKLGMLSGRTAQYFQPRLVSLLPAPLQSNSTASAPLESQKQRLRPLQPVLQRPATGGGRTHVNLLFVRSPLIEPEPQGSAALTRSWKVQHAGSLERAGQVAGGHGSAGQSRQRRRRAAQQRSTGPTRWALFIYIFISGATLSLGRWSQMHRLIFIYILVCANFCSYRDTFATPQSASIKTLRNANRRREGKRLTLPSLLTRSHLLLFGFFGPFSPPPAPPVLKISNELRRKALFGGGWLLLRPQLRQPLLPELY